VERRLKVLVHHHDAQVGHTGDAAGARTSGCSVISIENDWKRIFAHK
jgi:hypothetical protein